RRPRGPDPCPAVDRPRAEEKNGLLKPLAALLQLDSGPSARERHNMATPVLQVKHLTTRFRTEHGEVTAVDNVSFEVHAGETLAIVGESGSGKSVTSMSILGLIPSPPGKIEQGEILFEGQDLLKLSAEQMRRIRGDRIAMIFQDSMASLNPSITIGKQIAEPVHLHRNAPWSAAYERAAELLGRVQIPDAKNRLASYPHLFSGGMRQRAMIAM